MKGLEKIEVEIAQLVRRTVADSLRAGGSIAKEVTAGVRDVVSGAIQATENAGTDCRSRAWPAARWLACTTCRATLRRRRPRS